MRNRALNRLRDKRTDGIPIEGPEPLFTNPEALQLEADEMMLLVAEAVSQLPDRCREVFRKSREEGLSNAAIADQMRISVKTVEAQITKALRRIRETLLRRRSSPRTPRRLSAPAERPSDDRRRPAGSRIRQPRFLPQPRSQRQRISTDESP